MYVMWSYVFQCNTMKCNITYISFQNKVFTIKDVNRFKLKKNLTRWTYLIKLQFLKKSMWNRSTGKNQWRNYRNSWKRNQIRVRNNTIDLFFLYCANYQLKYANPKSVYISFKSGLKFKRMVLNLKEWVYI